MNIKSLIVVTLLLATILAPCNLATRSTTFTVHGTPYPAKCLNAGHRTLGCTYDTR